MIKTFTPELEITPNTRTDDRTGDIAGTTGPSEITINNILSYSKNLEIKRSDDLGYLEYLKS